MKPATAIHTAIDMVKKALASAEKFSDHNIFISMNEQAALAKAAEIDKLIAEGKPVGPLAGIPYALKDNFLSPEGNSTAASKMLSNFHSPITATAVKKLEDAGAIMIGRTNLDAYAHGSSTENSHFGPTLNSRDKTRVAGGSSGGSAVAVALGIVPFALGTDTGGSIRQPAAYNGVVGFKPTYGTVSRYGVVAMASSTDVVGCFATTASDADLIMSIISGKDEKDSTTLDNFWETSRPDESKPLRIGVISDFMPSSLDPEVRLATENYIAKLKSAGHTVSEVSIPLVKYALAIYYVVQPAEVASNLARYDGIRYGHRATSAKSLSEIYGKSRDEGFMPENKRRILIGNFVLSSGFFDAYYLKAQKARTLLIDAYNKAFENLDVLVCPTTPSATFELGAKVSDPVEMYLEDVMTVPPNMAGLPAISVPAGETKSGLTLGVQLIGPRRSDRTLLKLAAELE